LHSTIALFFLQDLIDPKKGVNDAVKPSKWKFRPGFTLKRVWQKFIKDLIYILGKFNYGKCKWPQGKTIKIINMKYL
jgi:hypothetical protein